VERTLNVYTLQHQSNLIAPDFIQQEDKLADYKSKYRNLKVITSVELYSNSLNAISEIPLIAKRLNIPATAKVTITEEDGGLSKVYKVTFVYLVVDPVVDDTDYKHYNWYSHEQNK
jgi:hypothetical protein